jgi:hypothetical protein
MPPDEGTYSAAISACEMNSEWQLALILLSRMVRATVLPDENHIQCIISACEKASQ